MSVESINSSSVVSSTVAQNKEQPEIATQETRKLAGDSTGQLQQPVEESSQAQTLTRDEINELTDKLNEFVDSKKRNLSFSVDEDSNNTIIKVLDSETQEVIRQFPSEEAVKLAKYLEDAMGLIFNDHA